LSQLKTKEQKYLVKENEAKNWELKKGGWDNV